MSSSGDGKEPVTVLPSSMPHSQQLEDKIVHCVLCLKRERQLFAKCKGFGQMSNVKSYLVTTPTCILNRHLKEQHIGGNHRVSWVVKQEAGADHSTKYAEGVSELRRASSRYDLNRDFSVVSS